MIVGSAVANLIATIVGMRRKPPVAEELYRDFLSKADHTAKCDSLKSHVDALDAHNTETHVEIFTLIRAEREWATAQIKHGQDSVQADFKVLERGLGRVEGEISRIAKRTE